MIHAWTSQPYLIDAVRTLFDLTTKIVDGKVEQSEENSRTEPSTQLPDLVTIYIRSMKERLDWFSRWVTQCSSSPELISLQHG